MSFKVTPPLVFAGVLVLALLAGRGVAAQSYPGLRHVERLSQGDEPIAYSQVWDITSEPGDDCRTFFATNDGLCVYDGVRWNYYKPEGNSIIRALCYDAATQRTYSAGVNEFGYWTRDPYGRFVYTLLYRNPRFRSKSNDFWRIAVQHATGRVFFQCREKICMYDTASGSIRDLLPEADFRYMYALDGTIYFQDGPALMRLEADLSRTEVTRIPSRIINLVSNSRSGLIAAVERAGLLRIDADGRTTPLDKQTNAWLADAKITCCRRYNDSLLLVGTTRRGLFLVGENGAVDHSLHYGAQLDNATILSAAPDARGNIWLGLDSGVASIDNSTGDYYLTDNRLGQVHGIVKMHDGSLAVGSNKGLFRMVGNEAPELVPGSTGVVWDLIPIDGAVYVLHDQGLYRLADNLHLESVMSGFGVHSLCRFNGDNRYFVAGTYLGVCLMKSVEGRLSFVSHIAGYNGYTRDLHIDDRDRVWVTVQGVGFVRLTLSEDRCRVVEARDFDLGTDRNVLATSIDQQLLFCCDDKAYGVDSTIDSLVRMPGAEQILKLCGSGVKSITQSGNRFWYVAADGAGYVERSGTSLIRYAGVLEQAARERISMSFRVIDGMGAIGFRNGVGFSSGGTDDAPSVGIAMVTAQGPNQTRYHDLREQVFEIPASMNTLRIYPLHLPSGHLIEYRIASLSPQWQSVRVDKYLQISALPHGSHLVELRTPGTSDSEKCPVLTVRVLPPWYIAWPTIVIYILIVAGLLAGVRTYYIRKSRLAQTALHAREKERRVKELERLERENLIKEKRISELEREKLKSDLRNKDKRLANITMNTIKRNSMLNELKGEVSELMTAEPGRIKGITGRIVRQINAQLKDDSDWHLSENYFNTIYDGLLDRLRMQYPTLSQTDLRLCVYIKLNLSTKETAELMNISPRSVEMARYRLRKKLGLAPNDNIGSVLQ